MRRPGQAWNPFRARYSERLRSDWKYCVVSEDCPSIVLRTVILRPCGVEAERSGRDRSKGQEARKRIAATSMCNLVICDRIAVNHEAQNECKDINAVTARPGVALPDEQIRSG